MLSRVSYKVSCHPHLVLCPRDTNVHHASNLVATVAAFDVIEVKEHLAVRAALALVDSLGKHGAQVNPVVHFHGLAEFTSCTKFGRYTVLHTAFMGVEYTHA